MFRSKREAKCYEHSTPQKMPLGDNAKPGGHNDFLMNWRFWKGGGCGWRQKLKR